MNTIKKTQAVNRNNALRQEAKPLPEQIDRLREQLAHAKARLAFTIAEKERYRSEHPELYDRAFFNDTIQEERDHIHHTEIQLGLLTDKQRALRDEVAFIKLLVRGE